MLKLMQIMVEKDLLDRVFAGSAAKLVMQALSARKGLVHRTHANPRDVGSNGEGIGMALPENLLSQGTTERLG